MRHLLLSCSASKDLNPKDLPAQDRYTGVAFKVLRNYYAAGGEKVEIWIISAKYGLIAGTCPISHYDLKMTRAIASEQYAQNTEHMRMLGEFKPKEMGVFLGDVYGGSIASLEDLLPGCKICRFKGPIGKMLQQLKNWLYEVPPKKKRATVDLSVFD